MNKFFNVDGYCDPEIHYMVDISNRLHAIKSMIDAGQYFTINRARQFGKTTILTALTDFLQTDYEVIYLDFQISQEGENEIILMFFKDLIPTFL